MHQVKRFTVILTSLLIFFSIPPAVFAQGESIEQFLVDLQINRDSSVGVTEKILYDFGDTANRHGIIRNLPLQYGAGTERYDAVIHVESVTDEQGVPYEYTETDGDTKDLKIGSASKVISGTHWYVIKYTFDQAINGFTDHDELYWNATGNRWNVPIQSVKVKVTLPQGTALTEPATAACYTGAEGSRETQCSDASIPGAHSFETTGLLGSWQGLTIVYGFSKGVVIPPAILSITTKPDAAGVFLNGKSFGDTPRVLRVAPGDYQLEARKLGYDTEAQSLTLISGGRKDLTLELKSNWMLGFLKTGLPLGFLGAMFLFIFTLWWKKGRELPGRGTIIAEYEPPDDLRPGEIGVILDQSADMQDITATIVDLAVRGFLQIRRDETPGLLWGKNESYSFIKLKDLPSGSSISEFERKIFEGVFASGKKEVALTDLMNQFYVKLPGIKKTMYEDVIAKDYFPANPNTIRWIYRGIGIGVIFVGYMAGGMAVVALDSVWYSVALIGTGLLFIIFAKWMPKLTQKGRTALDNTLGLKLFLKVTATDRLRMMQGPSNFEKLFEKLLPYAIVLGVEKEWAKHFDGLLKSAPTWYVGTGPFSPMRFTDSLHSMSAVAASAMSSRPTSSSGHSGFGGGGFSGGGFGGGGGSSW